MKFFKCKYCKGELDILVNNITMGILKIKCTKCGFQNKPKKVEPEIIILNKSRKNM